jgi:hypothetical protein
VSAAAPCEQHTSALLAALVADATRARERIRDIPLSAAMFSGPHAHALNVAMAMPPEALNLRSLGAALDAAGRENESASLTDDIIARGTVTPEAAPHHARELVRIHAAHMIRSAGERLANDPQDPRARTLLAEADRLGDTDEIRARLWAIAQEKQSTTEAQRKAAAAVVEWLHKRRPVLLPRRTPGLRGRAVLRRDAEAVAARTGGRFYLAWLADALAMNRAERVFARSCRPPLKPKA